MANKTRIDASAVPARDDPAVPDMNAQPPIEQSIEDVRSFDVAQDKAREWADRGIELSQLGDTERARDAERCAAAWVARMVHIEAGLVCETPSPRLARLLASKAATARRLELSAATQNNVTLLAWRR